MTRVERRDEQKKNVIDYYAYWSTDAIRADLDKKRHNFSVLISNEFQDFNIGSVIRNANAFLAREVIIYGRKQYDRRGTVGTHLYENMKHVRTVDELPDFSDSRVIGIDNVSNATPIQNVRWDIHKHVVMVFGQEQIGITDDLKAICDDFVYIQQYGSVRSLNVGCASAIAMYAYCIGGGL